PLRGPLCRRARQPLPARRSSDLLSFEPLIEDELVFVVRAGHPLEGAQASLGTLLRQPFVVREYGSGTRAAFEKAQQRRQRRLRRSEEHTSELQSRGHLVCRPMLE